MSKPWEGTSEALKDNSGSKHTSFKLKAAKGTIICPRHRTYRHQNSLENGPRKKYSNIVSSNFIKIPSQIFCIQELENCQYWIWKCAQLKSSKILHLIERVTDQKNNLQKLFSIHLLLEESASFKSSQLTTVIRYSTHHFCCSVWKTIVSTSTQFYSSKLNNQGGHWAGGVSFLKAWGCPNAIADYVGKPKSLPLQPQA